MKWRQASCMKAEGGLLRRYEVSQQRSSGGRLVVHEG